jgi:hypothetical protein
MFKDPVLEKSNDIRRTAVETFLTPDKIALPIKCTQISRNEQPKLMNFIVPAPWRRQARSGFGVLLTNAFLSALLGLVGCHA